MIPSALSQDTVETSCPLRAFCISRTNSGKDYFVFEIQGQIQGKLFQGQVQGKHISRFLPSRTNRKGKILKMPFYPVLKDKYTGKRGFSGDFQGQIYTKDK